MVTLLDKCDRILYNIATFWIKIVCYQLEALKDVPIYIHNPSPDIIYLSPIFSRIIRDDSIPPGNHLHGKMGRQKEYMRKVDILEMLKAGLHFGHQTSRWHPKMKPFIYTARHGVHIIDLDQTAEQLKEVYEMVKQMAAEGKKILFVSTKPQAKSVIEAAAQRCNMPYLTDRWIGGLLTNFSEMKKLIRTYNDLKEQQASGELEKYTKKERLEISKRLEKMDGYVGGIKELTKMPDAIFTPSVQREKTAITEANRTGVSVIGVCDTNANPRKVDHVIAGNDDALRSIELVVNLMADAAEEGNKLFEKNKAATEKNASTAPKTETKKDK